MHLWINYLPCLNFKLNISHLSRPGLNPPLKNNMPPKPVPNTGYKTFVLYEQRFSIGETVLVLVRIKFKFPILTFFFLSHRTADWPISLELSSASTLMRGARCRWTCAGTIVPRSAVSHYGMAWTDPIFRSCRAGGSLGMV